MRASLRPFTTAVAFRKLHGERAQPGAWETLARPLAAAAAAKRLDKQQPRPRAHNLGRAPFGPVMKDAPGARHKSHYIQFRTDRTGTLAGPPVLAEIEYNSVLCPAPGRACHAAC